MSKWFKEFVSLVDLNKKVFCQEKKREVFEGGRKAVEVALAHAVVMSGYNYEARVLRHIMFSFAVVHR